MAEHRKPHAASEVEELLLCELKVLEGAPPASNEATYRRRTLIHAEPVTRCVVDGIRSEHAHERVEVIAIRASSVYQQARPDQASWTPQTSPGQYPAMGSKAN